MTRRHFAQASAAALAAQETAQSQSGNLTAAQVIARIQQQVGVPWKTPTRDVFKAGSPDTPIRGIATTVMATLGILQRAASSNKNLIITHEPTFWSDGDATQDIATDAVYRFKADFIAKNQLVIWRFHDHWHARSPDAMLTGLAQALRWTNADPSPTGPRIYEVPPTTIGAMAKDLKDRLKVQSVRILGDPNTKVTKGAMNVGSTSLQAVMRMLPQVDVFVAGEPREWEGPEYVQDAIAMGQKKGMIIIGHQNSEDPGMRLCAEWLKTFVTEVPIEWIPTADPFWRA